MVETWVSEDGKEKRGKTECHLHSNCMRTHVRIWFYQVVKYKKRTEKDQVPSPEGCQWRVYVELMWIPSTTHHMTDLLKSKPLPCQVINSKAWTRKSCVWKLREYIKRLTEALWKCRIPTIDTYYWPLLLIRRRKCFSAGNYFPCVF